MNGERWLWRVKYFDEESSINTCWVIADTVDEALAWVNNILGEEDRIDSIVCKGLAEVLPVSCGGRALVVRQSEATL